MSKYKLKAGVGSAEICFREEMFPTDRLFGVHDAPHVRVLILDAGKKAAIVAVELVNGDCFVDYARRTVEELADVPYANVWVHVTHAITTPHTPGGPTAVPGIISKGPGGPGQKDPEAPKKRALYQESVEKAIREAVAQAAETMQEASFGVGTGACHVASNRDVETPFGWWTGLNPEGITNEKMTVLRFDGANGQPIGIFVSYGIKPCAIDMSDADGTSRLVSSDVAGEACRLVEEKLGCPCLFAMSAAGDQVPREQTFFDHVNTDGSVGHVDMGVEKGLEIVARLGKEMGESILGITTQITQKEHTAEVAAASGKLLVAKRNGGRPNAPVKAIDYTFDVNTELEAEAIRLSEDFAFVAVRPEINAQTERELWEQSPFAHTVLLSMVNGGMKYMPDRSAYDRCTWEAQSSALMPGSAEKWVARAVDVLRSLKEKRPEPVITAVVEPFPDGARITKAVLEFVGEVPNADALEVSGRSISTREVSGRTVTLHLSPDDKEAKLIPGFDGPPPGGPHGPGGPGLPGGPKGPRHMPEKKLRPAAVEVLIPGFAAPVASSKVSMPVIEDFAPGTFRRILYNLYVPKEYDKSRQYPLVLFIPDASANGNDARFALYQGIGATIWADPERQKKDPCFVLAVQIPSGIMLTTDEYTTSDELNDIKELLDQTIERYHIDRNRIYTTGQSQGCMASCELNCLYPDFFAASMLIAGHWDVEKMTRLTGKKFFFGLSEGGLKEYPNFNAITDGLAAKGVRVGKVRLNYRDGWEINERKVREAAQGMQVVYVIFDKATAFPEGMEVRDIMHHARGWELCYQLDAALDWVLSQTRGES